MTLKYLSLKLRSSIVSFFGGPAEASLEGAQGVEGLLLISMYNVHSTSVSFPMEAIFKT